MQYAVLYFIPNIFFVNFFWPQWLQKFPAIGSLQFLQFSAIVFISGYWIVFYLIKSNEKMLQHLDGCTLNF